MSKFYFIGLSVVLGAFAAGATEGEGEGGGEGGIGHIFTDVTDSAGVSYVQHMLTDPDCRLDDGNFCDNTAGFAIGDYNGDGWDDLFVTRLDSTSILFENDQDGTFTDVSVSTGLGSVLRANGAGWPTSTTMARWTSTSPPWAWSVICCT